MQNVFKALFLAILSLSLFASSPAWADDAPTEEKHECVCSKAADGGTGWCEGCKVGYIDGEKAKCKSCYDGKTGTNTWCEHCGVGYVEKAKVDCKKCYEQKANSGPSCEEHAA